jgi:hypothetical protein
MASGVALGLCGGEVERGKATQEFRASIQVKTGTAPAEVNCQGCQAMRVTGAVHHIQSNRGRNHHSNCLALVKIFSLAWYEGIVGSPFELRPCYKQYFKGKEQSPFLDSLDQRS